MDKIIAYIIPHPKLDGINVTVSGRLFYCEVDGDEWGEYDPVNKKYYIYENNFWPIEFNENKTDKA